MTEQTAALVLDNSEALNFVAPKSGSLANGDLQMISGKITIFKGSSIITIWADNPDISPVQVSAVLGSDVPNGRYFVTDTTASVLLYANDIINRLRPALAKGVEISLTYVTGIDPNISPNMVELRIGTQTFPLTIPS
jgi:hypothetical protein